MKTLLSILCFITLFSSAFANDLEKAIPKDTLFFAKIKNLKEFTENAQNTSLYKLWCDPEIVKYSAPLRKKIAALNINTIIKEQTGQSVEELLAILDGQLLIALTAVNPESTDAPVEGVILIETKNNLEVYKTLVDKLSKAAIEKSNNKVTLTTKKYKSYVINIIKPKNENIGLAWSFVNDILIISTEKTIKSTITLLNGKSENITVNSVYKKALKANKDSDSWGFVNLKEIMIKVKPLFAKLDTDMMMAAMGVTSESVFKGLGLDVFQYATMSFTVGKKDTEMTMRINYTENRGLVSLMNCSKGNAQRRDRRG